MSYIEYDNMNPQHRRFYSRRFWLFCVTREVAPDYTLPEWAFLRRNHPDKRTS